jgi:multidrug efflux system outer membrane protein
VKKLLPLLFLCGCMMGPNYVPPEVVVSDEWVEETDANERLADWWTIFNDPLLSDLLTRAVEQNKSLKSALANIEQAIALRQIAASALFPQINSDINATRTYFSKNGPVFAIGPSTGSAPGTPSPATGLPFVLQIPQTQNLYNFLFDATWELDLFGKTRRSIEAQQAEIGVVMEERNGLLLSILAEVSRNYMQLRSNQQLAAIKEKTIELLKQIASIRYQSLQYGYINLIDYDRSLEEIETTQATLPPLVAESYKNIYALSVLTGSPPETLLPELLPLSTLPNIPQEVGLGLRSELLRRRPDIRIVERKLAQATANIGIAVASFFPALTLYGDFGLQSLFTNNLFTWKSRTWAYGGDITTPLFQGGRLFGNLHASQAAKTSIAMIYEQTVLTALQEAESYLAAYHQDLKTISFSTQAVGKNQDIVSLRAQQYEQGLINRIGYLETEMQLLTAEQTLITNQTIALIDLISLYKALGGGWECGGP